MNKCMYCGQVFSGNFCTSCGSPPNTQAGANEVGTTDLTSPSTNRLPNYDQNAPPVDRPAKNRSGLLIGLFAFAAVLLLAVAGLGVSLFIGRSPSNTAADSDEVVELAPQESADAPLVNPDPPTPAVTVTVTAPIPPVAAPVPARLDCTSMPGAILRSSNTNGWQVCSTDTWGPGLALNAASRVTGEGYYTGVPDATGTPYDFNCTSIGNGALQCSGGTVRSFPGETPSTLYLVR